MYTSIQISNPHGRQREIAQKNGIVYTPDKLSDYLAEKTLQYVYADKEFMNMTNEWVSIVDPACGDGILLQSISNIFAREIKSKKITLYGFDVDQKALARCRKKLQRLDASRFSHHTINANSLCWFTDLQHENSQTPKRNIPPCGFDVIIANPPWGADITDYRDKLKSSRYSTLIGQVNSFELFMELATKIVRVGGYFAFIVPDSILNHGQSILRDIIVESTEIKFIARLGEKIFPNINRACAIIICKNSHPSENSITDCFRLSSKDRSQIINGCLSFRDAEVERIHKVPQNRFLSNKYKQFDIDLKENETRLVRKFQKSSQILSDMLSGTRGVELGSSGMIDMCPICGTWSPLSMNEFNKCKNCGKKSNIKKEQMSIISQKQTSDSKPIILGRDMKRYVAKPSKWIKLEKNGINYKSKEIYESPKILIRKTGVGITAALDYTNSYTNQVVYILRSNGKSNLDLEFFIALINSRAYYFYLIKAFGELEWKSHPYLTQTQVLSLPLPDLKSEKNIKIAKEIALLLRPELKNGKLSRSIDLKIELMVGKIFWLKKKDYQIIFDAINDLDELLPVRELKTFDQKEFLKILKR